MICKVFLFHADRFLLIHSISVFDQKDIDRINDYVRQYEEEENCKLVRAVLGQTDLVTLDPDEDLRLPAAYAEPISGGRR
ncbi:MAG: hypothetical protein PHH09_04060 [Methanoregulaceae archaeon]|nr:hypothetical protein [Methanoregulaceae archaeon]